MGYPATSRSKIFDNDDDDPLPPPTRHTHATMGLLPTWLGGTPSPSDDRAQSIRSGTVAPTRSERQRCWEARDAYFSCLDAHNIVDALKDNKAAGKACGAQSAQFEQNCATQWVTYFKKWRVQELQKKVRLKELEAQGAVKMDVNAQFTERR
ncbi:cytochrome oxidase c subunit VIb-domain-containing protein [Schizothecium vesticola]|uniref:Cytochrome oxidase c subunit VIb-domain-containing protein n=1 Tax=Schizothecium vesticola TaxID=314040 RepID=A0AA40F2I6_9PEZI|nr:cytochrome oxidase c subunit VIb-domain-containing protein [Schizothecium vesticola]